MLIHYMKKYFLLLLPFLFGQICSAQFPGGFGGGSSAAPKIYDGKISGLVKDKSSGNALEFANIALYEMGSEKPADGTVTDEKGIFRLKNIKNGKYKVTV